MIGPDTPALDVVWLAGLLEGEGAFDLHRDRYPRVRVGMTDRDIIERAARLMGANARLRFRRAPNNSMWHAERSGPDAVTIMCAILPHMGARRSARISYVLANAPANGRKTA